MSFKSQIITDAQAVFLNLNEIGEAITYTPLGGSVVTITAAIEREPHRPMKWDDGTGETVEADVYISNDSIRGIPEPSPRDKVAFGGANYYVKEITGLTLDAMWKLKVARVDVNEHGAVRSPR